MSTTRLLAGLLALAIFLPECAAQDGGPRAESKAALDAAAECCALYGEFEYLRMPLNFPEPFPVGRKGAAYAFPGGKSFFVAFELPRYESSFRIEVTTRITGGGYGEAGTSIFCPVALFLNGAYQPIGYRRDLHFTAANPRTRSGNPGLTGTIVLKESIRTARYIVFLTDPLALAGRVRFSAGSAKFPGGSSITLVGAFDVPCGHEGLLEVVIPFAR